MIDRSILISNIADEITAIKRKMAQEMRCCALHSDITYTQAMIIKFINLHEKANIKEIAESLGVTSSAATQQVDSLEINGYLTRVSNNNDRRSVNIVLTEKTQAFIMEIKSKLREQLGAIFEVLSDDELRLYAELNSKITKSLKIAKH